MSQALRAAAASAFLVALSGCNLVVSEEPWFTAADAAPEPTLRDGLWLGTAPDCPVDEAKPAEKWPDCASATFVRGRELWSMQWDDTDERGRRRRTFAGWKSGEPDLPDALLIANGDHLIVQAPSDAEEAGQKADGEQPGGYTYAALRPVRHDEQGKVTAMELWLVQCGPLARPQPSRDRRGRSRRDDGLFDEDAATYVTDQPFPGLTVVENDCVATSVDALRKAAILSEALAPHHKMRWVRDGWR